MAGKKELLEKKRQEREENRNNGESSDSTGTFTVDGKTHEKILNINIDLVSPDPKNARKIFNKEVIDDLALTIEKHGQLTPIIVRRAGEGGFIIIAGESRLKAMNQLGHKKIKAILRDADTKTASIIGVIDNIKRNNLTPIEIALKIKQQMSDLNEDGTIMFATQTELAIEYAGKNENNVSNWKSKISTYLKIAELPENIIKKLIEDSSNSDVKVLQALSNSKVDDNIKEKLFSDYTGFNLTRKEAIDYIREKENIINITDEKEEHTRKKIIPKINRNSKKFIKPKWGDYLNTSKAIKISITKNMIPDTLLKEIEDFMKEFKDKVENNTQ